MDAFVTDIPGKLNPYYIRTLAKAVQRLVGIGQTSADMTYVDAVMLSHSSVTKRSV